jgi:L-threonylcarbamoyladenylate synthase
MNAEARILPTDTPDRFAAAVNEAATCLRAGGLVAIPTETVYGLAANAFDADAVARIFAAKGRPAHNPIIVHVASLDLARQCTSIWPDTAERLATAFWPGPLTLVLKRSGLIPDVVTAGGGTVGLRWPRHPFAQALIRACGFPLAAPSANASNRLSPTCAEHVRKQLGRRIPLIVDGGPSPVGIESTVVDTTTTPPHLLRPGGLHRPALEAVIGPLARANPTDVSGARTLRSPGQLPRHYAPHARLFVWSWTDDEDLRQRLAAAAVNAGSCHVVTYSRHPAFPLGGVHPIPANAEAFARVLYAELHRCDDAGARSIVVETPPAGPEWQAIADRLQRAAL